MAQVMTKKDNLRLHEKQVRVAQVAHLGSMLTDCFRMPEVLAEFIDEMTSANLGHVPEPFRQCFAWLADEEVDSDRERHDLFADYVHNGELYGFLVEAHKPVEGSWGYCSTDWFYGATWGDVMTQVEAWAG